MAAESSSNLTTLSPSLRSSYADIAFGRQSPCPPGGAEGFVDGGHERESPPFASPPSPPQTPPICEKANVIVTTSQEQQQPPRPVNVPEQSHAQNRPEPPPRRYPRPSEKKSSSSFAKSLESGRPASASPHTASRPRRPPRLGHPHLKDSGRTESLDTQSEQFNVQRPHSALPPDTKSLTYDLRTESPSGARLLEGGKSPSYAQVFFQSNASLCSDQDSDHADLEDLPLDGVAIAESGAGLPPPPIDWDAWDAVPSPLRKEGADPEADILYRHPTIPGLILKRDTSPRPPSRSSRRHRGAGKNKDVGGDRGEEENDEFSLPEKVEVQMGDVHAPPQPPKRKQKKVGVTAVIAEDKKKVDPDSSLSEAGKTKKSKASEKAGSVKVEDKVLSTPSVPQESLKVAEPTPLDIDDVSMSSVSEASRGSKKKKKDKKVKLVEELSLKDATSQPLPSPMQLEDDNDSSSAAVISDSTGKPKKKKNKAKKPQEEDELEKALKEIAREEQAQLRQKRGTVASPLLPPQPKSLALDMGTDFFSEPVSKSKTRKESKKAKQPEQPPPLPKTEEKKESVVKVEQVEKLPDSNVTAEVSTKPSKVDDDVEEDVSEASKSKPQPKKKKKPNAKDGKGEDEVEKALREIQREEEKHKKQPPQKDKATEKKGKPSTQDSNKVDFPVDSPTEERIVLTEKVTEKASVTISDSAPPPEKDDTPQKSTVPEQPPPSPPKASKRKSKKSESSAAEVPQAAPTKVDEKPVIVPPSEELPKPVESGERQRTISLQAGDDWMAILDDDPSCMNWDDDEEETPSTPKVLEQVTVTPETKPPPPITTTIPNTSSKPKVETTTKSPPKDTSRQKSGKRKSKKSESESETKSVSSPKNDTTEQKEVSISTPLPASDVPLAVTTALSDKTVKGKSKKLEKADSNPVTEKPAADEVPLPKPSPVVAEVQPTAAPPPPNEAKPAALSLHGGDDWMSLLDDDSPMIWDDDDDEAKAPAPISTTVITKELSSTSTKPTDELTPPAKSIPPEKPEVTKSPTTPAATPAAGISLVGGDDWMSILDDDSPMAWDDEDGDDEGKSTVTVEHVPQVSQYLLDTYSTLEKPVQEKVVSPLFSPERMAQQQGKKKAPLPEEYQVFDDPAQAKTIKSEPEKPSQGKEKKATGKQQQAKRKPNSKSESDDVPASKTEVTTPTTTTESDTNDKGNKSKKGKRKSNKSESEEAIPAVDALGVQPKTKGTVSISQTETTVVLEIATPSTTPTTPVDKSDKRKARKSESNDSNVVSAEGPSVPAATMHPEKDMDTKKANEDIAAVEVLKIAVDPAPMSPGPQRAGSKKGKRQTKKSESEEVKSPPMAPPSEIPPPPVVQETAKVEVESTLETVPAPVATCDSGTVQIASEATPTPITPNRPGSQRKNKRNKQKSESEEMKVLDEPPAALKEIPLPVTPEATKVNLEVGPGLEIAAGTTPDSEILPVTSVPSEAAPISSNRPGSQKKRNKKKSESEEIKVADKPPVVSSPPLVSQESGKVEVEPTLETVPSADSEILSEAPVQVAFEAAPAPITPQRPGSQKKRNKKKSESEEVKVLNEPSVVPSPLVPQEPAKVDVVVEPTLEAVPTADSEISKQVAAPAPIAPNRPGSQKKRNKKKSESDEIKVLDEPPAALKEIPPLVAQETVKPDEVEPAVVTAITTPESEILPSKAVPEPVIANRPGSQTKYKRNKKKSESEEVKVVNEPPVVPSQPLTTQESPQVDVVEVVPAVETVPAPLATPDSEILQQAPAHAALEASPAPITPNRPGSQKRRNKKKSESEDVKVADKPPVVPPPLVTQEPAKVEAVEVEPALEIAAVVTPDSEILPVASAALEAAPISSNRPGSQKKRNKKKSESEEVKVVDEPQVSSPPLVAKETTKIDIVDVEPTLETVATVATTDSEVSKDIAAPAPITPNRPGSQKRRNKRKSESEEVKVADKPGVVPPPPIAPQETAKVDVVEVVPASEPAAVKSDPELVPIALEAAPITSDRPGSQKKRNKKKSESEEVKVVEPPVVPSPPQEPAKVDVVKVESALEPVPAPVETPDSVSQAPVQVPFEAAPALAPITPNRPGSQKKRNKKKSESEESQIPTEKPAQPIATVTVEPNSHVEPDSHPVVTTISEPPPKVVEPTLSSNRPVSKKGKRPNQKLESEEVSELPIAATVNQEVKVEATKGKRRGAGRKSESSESEPPTVKATQPPTEALPAPSNEETQSLLGELGTEAVVSTTTTPTQSSTAPLPLSINQTVEQTPIIAAATLPTPQSPSLDDSDVDLASVGPSDEFMASQQLLNLQLKHQQQQDEQRTAVLEDTQPAPSATHKSGSPKAGRSSKTGKLIKKASSEDSSSEEKRVRFKETPEVVKYSPTNSNVTPLSVAPAIALSPSADGDIDTASDDNSSSAPSSHSGGMKHKKKKKRSVAAKTSGGLAQSPLMWDSDPPPRSPSPLPPFERGDDEFTLVKSKKKNKPNKEEIGDNDVPPLEPIVVGNDAVEIRDTDSEKKEETIVVVVAEQETKAALFVDDNLLPPLVPPPLLETEVDGRSDSTGDSWTNILDEEEPKLTLAVEDMESLLNLEVEQVVRHDSPTGSDIKKKTKTSPAIVQPIRTSKNKEATKKELHREPEQKITSHGGEEGGFFTTAFLSAIHSENADTPTNYLDCSSAETLWQEYVALKSSKSGKAESKDEDTTTPTVLKDQTGDTDKKNKTGPASVKPQTLAEAAKEVTAQMEQLTKSIITPGPVPTTKVGGDDRRRDEHDYLSTSLVHLILLYNDYEREFREGSERRRLQAHEEEGKQEKKESGGGGGGGTCPKKPPGSDQPPPSTGGGSSGGGRKGPVTELLCAGLPSLNWVDWSTSLSGGEGLACHSPPTPAMQANLCKIKESALEDVAVLGQAVDAAIATLGTLSSASLTDTVERTWELLGGLKDLEGASRSLGEILASLPSSDEDVAGLVRSLGEVERRLLVVTEETRRLNESAKVTRSTESKRMMGGRLTFGAGPAIALLHLRRHQATTFNSKGQRS